MALAALKGYIAVRDRAFAKPASKGWISQLKRFEADPLLSTDITTIDTMKSGGIHQSSPSITGDFAVRSISGPVVVIAACIDGRPLQVLNADGSSALERDDSPPAIALFTVAHYDAAGGRWLVRAVADTKPTENC